MIEIDNLDELKNFATTNLNIKISVDNWIENQNYNSVEELNLSDESVIKLYDYTTCQTRTFSFDKNQKSKIKFINEILPKKLYKFFKRIDEKTTDDLRNLIEDEALKYDLVPIQNCYSYTTNREKWFVLNYLKKYDVNDYLIGDENLCFDIEKEDEWDINIQLIENTENTYKVVLSESDIYEITGNQNNLKLDCSKKFFNTIKTKKFIKLVKDNTSSKDKLGLKECIEKELVVNIPSKKLNDKSLKVYVFRDSFKI